MEHANGTPLPRTETFTDAAGRPAVHYLEDDVALGIAAGSELLIAPAIPENTPLYVAGWNTPGYLPETDPAIFDVETDAIRYLSDTVDRFWDEDYDASDGTRESWNEVDGKWRDVRSNLPYETAPFNIITNDRSLTFWVTVVPRSDYPYNAEGN